MRSRSSRTRWPPPLFWQLFLSNTAVLVAAVVTLALSPATVSQPVTVEEVVVLLAGVGGVLGVNLFLIRRAVGPLEKVLGLMRRIDPLEPGVRDDHPQGSAEMAELAEGFNEMAARLESERQLSAGRMLLAQERERRRLAQELHDEIGQSLTALMLEIDHVARASEPQTREALGDARENARRLSNQVRDVVRGLRPDTLDDLGLASALEALCERFSLSTGIRVERSIDTATADGIDTEVALVIYRVTQEALTNVARHSSADSVDVQLGSGGGELSLLVSDDGKGMPDGIHPGFGIQGMRERALLVDGRLSFSSANGRGPGLTVRLDLPRDGGS